MFSVTKNFGDMWLINEIEKLVDLQIIVNSHLIKRKRTRLPQPGIYFLIAAMNRLIEPLSKNKIPDWLNKYDIDHIFDEKIDQTKFTSASYWQQWDSIDDNQLESIGNKFLQKCSSVAKVSKNGANSFDTTNFYLYMASETNSEIAARGKNKQGRDNLRQIGLSFLIDNEKEIILHYHIYKGSTHDSKLFYNILGEMLKQAVQCGKEKLCIIFDKGMNSPDNMKILDNEENVHFITSYSPSNAMDLMDINLDKFSIIDCKHNRKIDEEIKKNTDNTSRLEKTKVIGFSTKREYWGKLRKVVIIYNPKTAIKQKKLFISNLEKLKNWLDDAKRRVKNREKDYTTKQSIIRLYKKESEKCHISSDIFELTVTEGVNMKLYYKKKNIFISDYKKTFGKSIIISDCFEYTTENIVQLFFDKYIVENAFRQCKNNNCCSVWPIFHWTDLKIKCHFFCSVIAYNFLKLIELKLKEHNIYKTGEYILNKMHNIVSNEIHITLPNLGKKKIFTLANIDEECRKIFSIFNYDVVGNNIRVKS